ncbi:MAG: YIP1 family protein [Candidatus Bathyarchaeota archaeon]|nr:YIP1 family protein [Candidatus Bathyarchaeota archaeon]
MNEENIGFVGKVSGVLRHPQESFSTISEDDLMKGLLIVLVTVVLAVASSSAYMSKIPLEVLVPQIAGVGDMSQIGGNMGLFAGIGVAFSVLAGYVLSTLIMHGVANLTGGRGNMKRFFAMHGFATTPHLVNYLLRTIDAYTISSQSVVNYFVANREIGNKAVRALMNSGLTNVFGLAVLVYLTSAVAENYGVSRNKAFIIALIPYLLALALNYFGSGA